MIIMIRKNGFCGRQGVLTAAVVLGAGIFTASGVLQEKRVSIRRQTATGDSVFRRRGNRRWRMRPWII